MPNIQWTSVIVAVGLWAVVRLWLSWAARRRAAQVGEKVAVRLSPSVILGFLIALGVVVPFADFVMDAIRGKATSLTEAMLNVVFGALGGAVLGGAIWLLLWLVIRFRRKDPSQHF